MKLINLITSLLILNIVSCQDCEEGGIRTGHRIEYYENGSIKSDVEVRNCKLEGWEKYYYPNGNLKEIGFGRGGFVDGEYKYYNEDGSLDLIKFYEKGDFISCTKKLENYTFIFEKKSSSFQKYSNDKNQLISNFDIADNDRLGGWHPSDIMIEFSNDYILLKGSDDFLIFSKDLKLLFKLKDVLEKNPEFNKILRSLEEMKYYIKEDSLFIDIIYRESKAEQSYGYTEKKYSHYVKIK